MLEELLETLDPTKVDVDFAMRTLVQQIIDRAKIFINRFQGMYFLREEPIHEFVGLEFRDPVTSKLDYAVHYRLVYRTNSLGIFTLDEVPIDDMYDVRAIIAESQLPEYSENKLPSKGA